MKFRALALLFSSALVLTACDNEPPDPCADVSCAEGESCNMGVCECGGEASCDVGTACEADTCVPVLPEAVCNSFSAWSPGTSVFREATADWGLEGVSGVRLNVADVDGDRRPDLIVRRGAPRWDDFGAEGVRRTWLLKNTGSGFEDITQSSGLLTLRTAPENTAMGRPVEIVAFGDVDNDGDLDAFLGMNTSDEEISMGERSEIMLNDGAGGFTLGPESEVQSPGRITSPAGASFIDFDRDGLLDLWVPHHNFSQSSGAIVFMQDRLYRGDGTGAFVEVTDSVGLATTDWGRIADLNGALSHTRAWGSAACDLNGDGDAELLAPSYGRSPNHLWQATRGGDTVSFINRSVESGFAFDDDKGWEDNQFALCFCASNPTAEGCEGLPRPSVSCAANWNHNQDRQDFRLGGNSAAVTCGDVDNDGDLDLFLGEIRHWWAGSGSDGSELLVNNGTQEVSFDRPSDDATGLGIEHSGASWDEGHMTNTLFDFDGDGWLDVYVGGSDYAGNRGMLYHQDSPLSFSEVSTADAFEHNRSHGVVTADFDGDGDLDIIVGHSRSRCSGGGDNPCYETTQIRAFENTSPAGNFIRVSLTGGDGTNRAAIGARVTVTAGGITQTREVDGGHGHYGSQDDTTLHFGLGEACEAVVTVRWPNAELTEETFTLPAGHGFELTQGEPAAQTAR